MQGGGGNSSSEGNVTSSCLNIEYCVTDPSSLPIPSDHQAPTFVQFDSLDGTTYFNDIILWGELSRKLGSLG